MDSVIYENLVPSWNAEKPKYMAFLRMILQMVDQIRAFLDSFIENFDLNTATGAQLDILGVILGASRVLPFAPAFEPRKLNDDDYRMYLRAKILMNTWDGTTEHAIQLYETVFPTMQLALVDGQDCSMKIVVNGECSDLQLEMMQRGVLIPHPAGVLITYEVPTDIDPTSTTIQSGTYQTGRMGIYSVGGATGGA